MRIPLLIVLALSVSSPAYADFFGDIGKSLERATQDAGHAVEKGTHDAGKTVEKGTQDTGHAIEKAFDANAFVKDLEKKTDGELLTLSFDPCSHIDCHGLPSDYARQAVNLVRTKKQNEIDLGVRQTQAQAAEASAVMAFLSLIISIASFARAGRPSVPQIKRA